MKDTDDGNQVDGSDAGAEPATSTKQGEYQGIIEFSKELRKQNEERKLSLTGRNVHGVVDRPPGYYYTPNEWSRSVAWDEVPDKRNSFYKAELEKLEKEIQYYPKHVKPMTKQWDRIQDLRKIMGVK